MQNYANIPDHPIVLMEFVRLVRVGEIYPVGYHAKEDRAGTCRIAKKCSGINPIFLLRIKLIYKLLRINFYLHVFLCDEKDNNIFIYVC